MQKWCRYFFINKELLLDGPALEHTKGLMLSEMDRMVATNSTVRGLMRVPGSELYARVPVEEGSQAEKYCKEYGMEKWVAVAKYVPPPLGIPA